MIKFSIFLIAIAAVHLEEFDAEDAKYICAGYSSDPSDRFAEKEGSELITYNAKNYDVVRSHNHFVLHQGRCGNVYCSDEYACICNNGKVYYNVCHMRSLGILKGYACECPDANSDQIIRNPKAKSHRAIKEYNRSVKKSKAHSA